MDRAAPPIRTTIGRSLSHDDTAMTVKPNQVVEELVDSWCERRELRPLAYVLPAWTGNNGLADGWQLLHCAVKHAYAMCSNLPHKQRDSLKKAYVAIDVMLRNRCPARCAVFERDYGGRG